MLHSYRSQVQRRKGRKPCLTYPSWLSDHPVCCHLWNRLTKHNDHRDTTRPNDMLSDVFDALSGTNTNAAEDRLPKNTGVIAHCLKVLWKFLMRPNYYNITVIYMFLSKFVASVTGTCYASHTASQVAAFGCGLLYHFDQVFAACDL